MKWRGLHWISAGKVMVDAGQRCVYVTEEDYVRLKLSPPLDNLERLGQQLSASGPGKPARSGRNPER